MAACKSYGYIIYNYMCIYLFMWVYMCIKHHPIISFIIRLSMFKQDSDLDAQACFRVNRPIFTEIGSLGGLVTM